ncbi:hypothetical protein AVEN_270481-1 [Araneus ventricosus]|uniref:Uncharacterized protein n=1 Tax=Araneus ventricosus TaxID=182803 RepID=A0A4Y2B577_ARAVE|nr:hypothetical protein AVEN_270481-1 [Araneus ventricosus]
MKGLPLISSTSRSEEKRDGRIYFTYPLVNKPPYTTILRFLEPSGVRGLKCNAPHTWWIFSEIGFRTWNLPDPKPRPYHSGFGSQRSRGIRNISTNTQPSNNTLYLIHIFEVCTVGLYYNYFIPYFQL